MIQGFRFGGVCAGIKKNTADLALITSDLPAAAAGVVTRNLFRASCVERSAALLPGAGIRAIVANSGNANAIAGAEEVTRDARMAAAAALALGVDPRAVLTASTGAIGVPLPIVAIEAAMPQLVSSLNTDPAVVARAIRTTDRRDKIAHRDFRGAQGTARILGIAKGAGMIHPCMATMLAFVLTDAQVAPDELDRAIREAVDESFHMISVDRDTSTNDAVYALANGMSAVRIDGASAETFRGALAEVLAELAKAIAGDGEGATRRICVRVSGAKDARSARLVARAPVESNLFKAAVFGRFPGWERFLAAVGARCAQLDLPLLRDRVSLTIDGVTVFRDGAPSGATAVLSDQAESVYELDLGLGTATATAWGCDLSYEYVTINAETKLARHAGGAPDAAPVRGQR
ncbi:MAG: bifunctional glutamate N-acetyltransferase/amino-acid acetyltransferase ArgJ [Candidatus Schekmanbacteria bacterium]|nr:bifunctional glutamate N-acetyltransferase/amino-acid acetyltransferase ArgJ [Candidatus Schekmanbacteria bacterium]